MLQAQSKFDCPASYEAHYMAVRSHSPRKDIVVRQETALGSIHKIYKHIEKLNELVHLGGFVFVLCFNYTFYSGGV